MTDARSQTLTDVGVHAREALFVSLDPHSHFNLLFEHLPGVLFFAKDRDGRILFANSELAWLYGFATENDFIGRTDFDVLPTRLAEKFRKDDIKVMTTGEPLLGIIELFLNPQGIPDWYLTNKLPLLSAGGHVVGLMGTIHAHREGSGRTHETTAVDRIVSHLRGAFAEDTPVAELASMCDLSTRQFEEKFKESYNTSPHKFRIRLRVMKACELLRDTNLSVSTIAQQVGFYDQSALSHHLKSIMGYKPLEYRKRYA